MDLQYILILVNNFFENFNFSILIVVLVIIILYLLFCYILNNMNKMLYGKSVWLSWIPIGNVYLIGKFVSNSLIGLVLLGAFILMILLNLFVLSNTFVTLLSSIYLILLFILSLYMVYKYFDLKKTSKSNETLVGNTLDLGNTNMNPTSTNGSSDITINNVSVIPTNDISNINSVSINNNEGTKKYVMPKAILNSGNTGLDALNNVVPIDGNKKEENLITSNNIDNGNLEELNIKPVMQNENTNLSNENNDSKVNFLNNDTKLSQNTKMNIDSLLDINKKI